MTKARLTLLALLAATAFSTVAATAASAHEFIVEKAKVTEALTGTGTSGTSVLRLSALGTKIAIVSTLDTGTFTIEPAGKSTFKVSLTGNTLYKEEANGHLVSQATKCQTTALIDFEGTDELLESGGKWLDTFAGTGASKLFTKFKISKVGSENCAIAGEYELAGTFNAILIEPTAEKKLHVFAFLPKEAGSQNLTFAGNPATFESIESIVLSGTDTGKDWSGV